MWPRISFYDYAEWTPVLLQVRTDVRKWAMNEEHLLLIGDQSIIGWKGPYMWESLDVISSFWKKWQLPAFHGFLLKRPDENGIFLWGKCRGAQWDGIMSNGAAWILSLDNKWTPKSHQLRRQVDLWSRPFHQNRSLQKRDFRMGNKLSRLDLRQTRKIRLGLPFHVNSPRITCLYWNSAWDNPPPPAGANVLRHSPLCFWEAFAKDFEKWWDNVYRESG